MTQFEFAQIRRALGVSLDVMAEIVGLGGANAYDSVRKMELGKKAISEPVARLAYYASFGTELAGANKLPKFTLGADLSRGSDTELIHHNHFPRCLFAVTDRPPPSKQPSYTIDGVEWVVLLYNFDRMSHDELQGLLIEAANLFAQFTQESVD